MGNLFLEQVSDGNLTVGGAVPLSVLIQTLLTQQDSSITFSGLAAHLAQIANLPVRNVSPVYIYIVYVFTSLLSR